MIKQFQFLLVIFLVAPNLMLSQNESTQGSWGDPIPFGIVPVAVANLPNGNLITWSSQFRNSFRTEGDGMTFTELFDPQANGGLGAALGDFTSNTDHDMFCPGINNLADGRILSAGGTSSEKTSIYDWRTNEWTVADQMNIPRGYQGNVTLSDGSVFTVGGSWSGGNWGNRDAEIYSSLTGWLKLPNIQGEDIFVNADYQFENQGNYRIDNHVWLWPAPNGKLFHAGPSEMMHWIDLDVSGGEIVEAGIRQDGINRDYYSMKGNTVMFDTGKILKTGGARAYGDDNIIQVPALNNSFVIDLNGIAYGAMPNVTYRGTMLLPRTMHNSTVLPNGEVLVTGGLQGAAVFTDDTAVLGAEIFNENTGWRTVAGMTVPRTYHSVAILMVDGRVFVGGGGLCDSTEDCVNHFDAEIYSPPYLFNPDNSVATRPVINSGPLSADYNQQITVSATAGIQEFSLIRFSAATHSTNNEQRRIPINSFSNNGNDYSFTIPQRELLPPGYYMLFALDSNGVPSIAHTIQIGDEIPLSNNSNLVLDMQFDESSGINATDSSQYGNNGIIIQRDDTGNPESPDQFEWSNGIIGNALEFDGLEFNSNSLLEIEYSDELASTANSITLSAWVYRDSDSGIPEANGKIANVGIFSQSYPSMFFGFHNTLYKWAFRADSPLDCYAGYAPLDTWVHLAATYDGNIAILYANGVEVCRRAMSGPIDFLNDGTELSSFTASGFYEDGGRPLPAVPYGNTSGITDEISGKMDLLKVYNKVLEPAEIQALYLEGLNTNNPQITNCEGNYLTVEYRIGTSGAWVENNTITAPEGAQVFIRPKNYTGEYIVTTSQYDGPTFNNVTNSTRFTVDNAYQIDSYVPIIPNFPPWDNPDRGNGEVDLSNEGQFVLTTPDGCPTTVYFSILQTNTGDGCPNYLPNDDPTIFITSGALNTGLDEANGTNTETNGSACALEIINSDTDQFARFTVSVDLAQYGIVSGNELYLEIDGKGDANPYFEIRRNNSIAQSPLASGPFGTDWTTRSGTIVVPPNTETLDLWLYPNYGVSQPGTAYFDNLKFINLTATGGNRPPTADFTINQVSGNSPLTVNLDASSSSDIDGAINNYEWDFGDGTPPSTLQATSHTYTDPGSYLLTLSVYDTGGLRDRKTVNITVNDASNQNPTAVVSANILSGNAPLEVDFTGSNSTDDGTITYAWDFGDGETASIDDPQHTFDTPGSYTVSLTVTDAQGAFDTETISIDVNGVPNAVVSANILSGNAPLEVVFTGSNSTDDGTITYAWDFGDGETASIDDPQHTFDIPGSYTVSLTVTDAQGAFDTETISIDVNGVPNAVVSANILSGNAPLEVDFTGSNSTDDGTITYAWDFGDGGTASIDDPQHTFDTPGSYTVSLTVTDAQGAFDTETISIDVNGVPNAVVSANILSGNAPLEVVFTGSNSTDDGTITYAWDFGDGETASIDDPQHTFDTPGSYTVSLTVTDAQGAFDTETISIDVNGVPNAVVSANILSGNAPLEVDFTGSNSTDDGTITYAWDFGDGGTASIDDPQHTFDTPGSYTVSLTVTDAQGAFDTETISIDVNGVPNAVASANILSGNAPLEVVFTGSNSTDDGTITYAWDFGDGVGTAPTADPQYTFNDIGEFLVTLVVTDDEGETSSDSITISVNDLPNQPPVAMISANPISGNAPLLVDFNGSNSTDDNGIVSYAWDFGDGIGTATTADPQYTFNDIGEFLVTLVVTDDEGETSSDTVTISVNDLPNQPPVAMISANPISGNAPLLVDFNGSNSTDDNGIVSYAWDFGDGVGTATTADPQYTFNDIGEFLVTLVVTDDEGETSSDSITISVNDLPNQPPVAMISANPISGNAPLLVDFNGSNSTDDNGIVSYAWDFGDGVGTAITADPQYTFNDIGEFLVTLVVTDDEGETSSDSITISVNDLPNQPPVAMISANPISGNAPLLVDFNGSNSTDDNGIVSYAWDFGDGVGTATTADPQYTFNDIGEFLVTLVVTDDEGETSSDTVTISVNDLPNQPPVAIISADPLSGNAPLLVDFTGSNSTDDNSIVSYAWVFGDGVGTATTADPQYTFNDIGEFLVTLVVTDDEGETSSDSITISVAIENEPLVDSLIDDIIVYPNPVRNETLKIELSKFIGKSINVGFYDIYGKLVLQKTIPADHSELFEVDLSILSSGIYLMELIKTKDDTSIIKKIVKVE